MADENSGPITVAQLVEKLKTLPQDLLVYGFESENGMYVPLENADNIGPTLAERPIDSDEVFKANGWLWPIYAGQEPVPPERQVQVLAL